MAILFATTSILDFPDPGDAVQYLGAAQGRDTDYVDEEIELAAEGSQSYILPIPDFDSAPTELWFHFRIKLPANIDSTAADGKFFAMQNAFGQNLAQIDVDNGDFRCEVATTNGAYWSPVAGGTYTFDIHLVQNGTTRSIELFVDGVSVSSASRSTTSSGIANVFIFSDDLGNLSTPSAMYLSEFIIDDADSTVGCRLHLERPAVAGHHSEMTGSITDIMDADTDFLTAASDGLRQSYQTLGYSGDSSPGVTVRAVLAYARVKGAVEGEGPHKFTPFLRIGTTDYYGAEINEGGAAPVGRWSQFLTDPSTGLAWDIADIGNWEGGVRVNT